MSIAAFINQAIPERIRPVVLALRRYPELNARIEGDEIVVPDAVNLGFAAQTDHGLVVPVVHDAHRLTTRDQPQPHDGERHGQTKNPR